MSGPKRSQRTASVTDHTRPKRKTLVTSVDVSYARSALNAESSIWEWEVCLGFQCGLKSERFYGEFFHSEELARRIAACFRVGADIGEMNLSLVEESLRKTIARIVNTIRFDAPFHVNPETGEWMAREVLKRAGISDGISVSSEVVNYLGEPWVQAIKQHFGKNWEIAAGYQYCELALDRSSLAYIAAAFRYCYFIGNETSLQAIYCEIWKV